MKWFVDILKKMDKTKWMILGLSGILLLVIALPVDERNSEREDDIFQQSLDEEPEEDLTKDYEKQLVSRLEQSLGCMDGVGEVRVMITFQDNGRSVVEKDITKSGNEQNAGQYQEASVYEENEGRQPYISQQKLPSVEGVLVIAQGGGDSAVKREILDAVMALFPVEAHKIKIVKMQSES